MALSARGAHWRLWRAAPHKRLSDHCNVRIAWGAKLESFDRLHEGGLDRENSMGAAQSAEGSAPAPAAGWLFAGGSSQAETVPSDEATQEQDDSRPVGPRKRSESLSATFDTLPVLEERPPSRAFSTRPSERKDLAIDGDARPSLRDASGQPVRMDRTSHEAFLASADLAEPRVAAPPSGSTSRRLFQMPWQRQQQRPAAESGTRRPSFLERWRPPRAATGAPPNGLAPVAEVASSGDASLTNGDGVGAAKHAGSLDA